MVLRIGHHRYIVVWYQLVNVMLIVEFMVLNLAFSMVLGMLCLKAVGPCIGYSNGYSILM